MRQAYTEDLASEETDVVHNKGGQAGLVDNIAPTIHGGRAGDFAPDNENECYVVYPTVYTVEQIVAEFCAVGQAPIFEM